MSGDLAEQYELDAASLGERRARRRYAWGVLRFFRPGIVFRNRIRSLYPKPVMIQNYVKTAARNLYKRKFFTLVNAFGLSIGITLCMLIWLYLQDERKFDAFHTYGDDIVRLHEYRYSDFKAKDIERRFGETGERKGSPYEKTAYLPAPLVPALKTEAPEVLRATHYNPWRKVLVKREDTMLRGDLAHASEDFLSMFSFKMLAGDSLSALSDKSSVVISESLAKNLFGDENPIGQTVLLDLDGEKPFQVSGVVEDVPAFSSLSFSMLIHIENRPYYAQNLTQWRSYSYPIFVQLKPGADREAFQRSLSQISERYLGEGHRETRAHFGLPDTTVIGRFESVPLSQIHETTDIQWFKVTNPMYGWILSGIALLILVIACINYVTLAMTTSLGRSREVGVRKSMGASRGSLFAQFTTESVIVSLLALLLASALAVLFLPSFNEFATKSISWADHNLWLLGGWALLAAVLVGGIAGGYPALYLSRLEAITALKGTKQTKVRVFFTRYLVVFQFMLSAFMLISAVYMYRQMHYVATKDLGFDKEHVVVIQTQQGWLPRADAFVELLRNRMMQLPSVESVGGVSNSFARGWSRFGYEVDGESKYAFMYRIDPEFLETLDFEVVAGRAFRSGSATDSSSVVVNEALVRDMGWDDPIGREVPIDPNSPLKVIGVVKDFHFLSLTTVIQPMLFNMNSGYLQSAVVRIKPGSLPGVLDEMKAVWQEIEPSKPFEYTFLDEDLAAQYGTYTRWTRMIGLATAFAIFIACLGLFGLAGVNAANRTKEVGIRKVMGAGMADIVVLLNRPFVVMAVVAFMLAVPAAWYAMDQWLANFEYSVALDWWVFAAAFVVSLMLALATVSFHAWRAANLNPVETLKYE